MAAYQNYLTVLEKIRKSTQRNITVVPVSKYAKIESMAELYNQNLRMFGESRVEKFLEKAGLFPESTWHMIGSIQTRKVKDMVGNFHLVHSLDREKLALEIDKRSIEKNVFTDALIQVNISNEETKSGLAENQVEDFLAFLSDLKHIRVRGLMTMAPYVQNPEEVRYVFKGLKDLQVRLSQKGYSYIKELSMGMSNDYLIAIEEGATIVRIGSEIFD